MDPSDFTYHEILGVGGFGFVVKVVKRSTGASYAMKIQNKLSSMITARDLITKKVRKLKMPPYETVSGHPVPSKGYFASISISLSLPFTAPAPYFS